MLNFLVWQNQFYIATYKTATIVATNITNALTDILVTASTTSNGASLLNIIVGGCFTSSDL